MKFIYVDGEEVYVSNEDHLWLSGFNWHINAWGYVYSTHKTNFLMHVEVFRLANPGIEFELIDHIDKNPLNNQRNNLRRSNNHLNLHNRKKQSGIHWFKRYQKYQVYININNKRIFLGYFKTIEAALEARLKAEQRYIKQLGET